MVIHFAPGALRRVRRRDRARDVAGGGFGNLADELLRRRIDDGDRFAAARISCPSIR
jgi:hypothetical protein